MTLHKAHIAATLGAVLLLSLPASAFNRAMARTLPVENITVDGDLSDWPPDAERWPIARTVDGEAPRDSVDFQGFFHIGYHAKENALYVAVTVQDESIVLDTTTTARVLNEFSAPAPNYRKEYDGCELYIHLAYMILRFGPERRLSSRDSIVGALFFVVFFFDYTERKYPTAILPAEVA
jgi:hypothetical protein